MGRQINTVMQPCFFALSGVLPREEAIAAIRTRIEETYKKRGPTVVARNLAAVDRALESLHEVAVPASVSADKRPARAGPGRRSGLRCAGDRAAAGRRRRPPSGECAAGGRHLPDRHREIREAIDRTGDPHLGAGALHRLREVRHGLPPRRHPHERLPRRSAGRRARGLPAQALPLPRDPGAAHDDPGRPRRLHGLRGVRGRVPGPQQGRGPHQVDQHAARGRAPGARARALRLLPGAAPGRPAPDRPGHGQGRPGPRAPLRVLGRLRRLRRDPLLEAPDPALR